MNLIEILRLFASVSGRYDLVNDDPSRRIYKFVNEACRNLDRLTHHQKSSGSHFELLAVDAYKVDIPLCRAIKEVWMSNTTPERWQIEKKDLQWIVSQYMSGSPDSGAPLYYSPVITRGIPEDADLTAFASYMQYLDTTTSLDSNYNAIVIVPPTSEQVLVEVRGLFYSKPLVEDTDENFWSVNHPLTLLKSIMRELEVFNQNRSKTKAWEEELATEITNISMDLVEEIIAEIDQIED